MRKFCESCDRQTNFEATGETTTDEHHFPIYACDACDYRKAVTSRRVVAEHRKLEREI